MLFKITGEGAPDNKITTIVCKTTERLFEVLFQLSCSDGPQQTRIRKRATRPPLSSPPAPLGASGCEA